MVRMAIRGVGFSRCAARSGGVGDGGTQRVSLDREPPRAQARCAWRPCGDVCRHRPRQRAPRPLAPRGGGRTSAADRMPQRGQSPAASRLVARPGDRRAPRTRPDNSPRRGSPARGNLFHHRRSILPGPDRRWRGNGRGARKASPGVFNPCVGPRTIPAWPRGSIPSTPARLS